MQNYCGGSFQDAKKGPQVIKPIRKSNIPEAELWSTTNTVGLPFAGARSFWISKGKTRKACFAVSRIWGLRKNLPERKGGKAPDQKRHKLVAQFFWPHLTSVSWKTFWEETFESSCTLVTAKKRDRPWDQ